MTGPSRAGGFTLVELMIATFIFAMVIAGLTVIYSSTYQQGFRSLREARLKNMSFLALKAIESELRAATHLAVPAVNTSGRALGGFKNYAPTYEPAPNDFTKIFPSENAEWFYFCVIGAIAGLCEDADGVANKDQCLFMYTGTGTSLPSGNCGAAGNNRKLLASSLVEAPGFGSGNFFSRKPLQDVDERNQVRVGFVMSIPGTIRGERTIPPLRFEVDSTLNMGFSESP